MINQIQRYFRRGVLIDTNLLLLLVVGYCDRSQISKFKPIQNQSFTEDDFDMLANFAAEFKQIVTTPHILTETSNLLGKASGTLLSRLRQNLAIYVLGDRAIELTESAKLLVKIEQFSRFGLTDIAIAAVARGNYLVLTTDFPLYGLLTSLRIPVINFNHLRELRWKAEWDS